MTPVYMGCIYGHTFFALLHPHIRPVYMGDWYTLQYPYIQVIYTGSVHQALVIEIPILGYFGVLGVLSYPMQNMTPCSCSLTPISYKCNEISQLCHLVIEIPILGYLGMCDHCSGQLLCSSVNNSGLVIMLWWWQTCIWGLRETAINLICMFVMRMRFTAISWKVTFPERHLQKQSL